MWNFANEACWINLACCEYFTELATFGGGGTFFGGVGIGKAFPIDLRLLAIDVREGGLAAVALLKGPEDPPPDDWLFDIPRVDDNEPLLGP